MKLNKISLKSQSSYLRSIIPCVAKKYCQEHLEFESQQKHHAIIIAISTQRISHRIWKNLPYSSGASSLVAYFLEKKLPYKVYECRTIDDFETVICNDKAVVLWIFGHGSKGVLDILNEKVRYVKYDTPKYAIHQKKAIYQFHCNCGNEKSLTEILANGNGIDSGLSDGKRNANENEIDIQSIIQTDFPEL